MTREGNSLARALVVFTASSLVVFVLVAIAGVVVLRRIAATQAREDAERVAQVAARGILEPRLQNAFLGGPRQVEAILAIERAVNGGLLRDPIQAIEIVDPDGVVRYANTPELIGQTTELSAAERAALGTDTVVSVEHAPLEPRTSLATPHPTAATSTPSGTSDSEASQGTALRVSVPVATPKGQPLLVRAWVKVEPASENVADLWPVLAVALIALALLQLPFAYRLARSVRASEEERERLLRRAIASSDIERRRIAADLHDGTIQQLAGLSMSLSAKADNVAADSPEAAASLRDAATTTRGAMRSLRSAVMGMSPPRLQGAGLPAALSDLVEPIADRTELVVPANLRLPPEVESLLFRAAQEALRNVVVHAGAEHVRLEVSVHDRHAALEVRDDGVGFSPEDQRRASEDGHLGLRLLEDLARDADGTLDVTSAPGEGTIVRLEVPLR